jgi:hypothetical protein
MSRPVRRKVRAKAAAELNPWFVIGGALGLLVVAAIGVVIALPMLRQGGGGGAATADLTPEQQAANQEAYEQQLERARANRGEQGRQQLADEYGADQVVAVTFKGVAGDRLAAEKYLQHRLFWAAHYDYDQAAKRAAAATEQNRKNAEEAAVQQSEQQFGGFGPRIVRYQYEEVKSDVRYPKVVAGPQSGTTYTFYAAPVLDVQAFVNRLNMGSADKVDAGRRTVDLSPRLPVPIPDPHVEDMVIAHGAGSVVKIHLRNAQGEIDRVLYHLEDKIESLKSSGLPKAASLQTTGLKSLGNGEYELYVAPVESLPQFSELLNLGKVEVVNEQYTTLRIQAELPSDLPRRPTPQELAEKRRLEHEARMQAAAAENEARALAAKEQMEQAREAAGLNDGKPKPDESIPDWAVRILSKDRSSGRKAVYQRLAETEVEPERLEEISALLVKRMEDSGFDTADLLKAMLRWRTKAGDAAIIAASQQSAGFHAADAYLQALSQLETPEAWQVLASALPNFHFGDKSVSHLKAAGPGVEQYVLPYLDHQDERVRGRALEVLSEVGTKRSLSKLSSVVSKDRSLPLRERAKIVQAAIRERDMSP